MKGDPFKPSGIFVKCWYGTHGVSLETMLIEVLPGDIEPFRDTYVVKDQVVPMLINTVRERAGNPDRFSMLTYEVLAPSNPFSFEAERILELRREYGRHAA